MEQPQANSPGIHTLVVTNNSNWTWGSHNEREIMTGKRNLANYLGPVKSLIMEEDLQLPLIKPGILKYILNIWPYTQRYISIILTPYQGNFSLQWMDPISENPSWSKWRAVGPTANWYTTVLYLNTQRTLWIWIFIGFFWLTYEYYLTFESGLFYLKCTWGSSLWLCSYFFDVFFIFLKMYFDWYITMDIYMVHHNLINEHNE